MVMGKRFGIVGIVFLMVLNTLPPEVWAQNPAPAAEPTKAQNTAAGMANIVYVPAKTLFCIGSGLSWLAVLVLSGGTAYNAATNTVKAGCGGKWVVKGRDIQFWSPETPGSAR